MAFWIVFYWRLQNFTNDFPFTISGWTHVGWKKKFNFPRHKHVFFKCPILRIYKINLFLNLTRWLPTTTILVVKWRIYCYQFRWNYLKNEKFLLPLYCIFGFYIKFWTFWNKNGPHSSSISEVIDSERRAYLNA